MNTIKAKVDKSDYEIYDDFMNIEIDGYWLDEKLDELYPKRMFKGLIPTLLFAMEIDKEKEVVWNRINPTENTTTICPILMCPDDCDFSCTLIIAEVEDCENTVKWHRLGIDKTIEYNAEKVGSEVEWFDKVNSFEFKKSDYEVMITQFQNQLKIDKEKWERRNRNYLKEN